ncbi:MAG TPA: 2Fe-2S iron-sulfur cluster-binding protein [Candidatus Polarisedimenticolia bacterium]|jgi:NADH-quinone oxidoreductase subunit G|nr:2Fe-2S iron-sulfur cluster-binding protein [Candidatus Polarisedimenticolia bacterium]
MSDPQSLQPRLSPPPHQPNVPAPGAAPVPGAAPAIPPTGPDEVALLIDDRPVVVRKGATVLQAAEKAGILVPHYCYHPGISIAGNCRMCLVEIEKMPKLQIGCATAAAPGMVVRTSNDRVKGVRAGIQEFLLINHPLDCPICDQAGECRLQSYEKDYGRGFSRFAEEKVHFPKRYDIGRSVLFDAERCIKCTRCIRFCDEVSKSHELALFSRGDHTIVGAFPGRPLDNLYSGCTVDVCPVGALTWKPFRFKARVWFLKNVPSVCAGCARGCNVNVATFRNRIHRMTPRVNADVNDYWMCDAGRQSYETLYARPRLEQPIVRPLPALPGAPEGPRPPAEADSPWDGALDRAAALLREVARTGGRDSLAAIVSARLSLEDLYVAKRVLGDLAGIPRLAIPSHEEGEDDHLLIRRDKTPNGRGAELLGLGAPSSSRVREILDDVASGRVKGVVVVGEDLLALPGIAPPLLDRLEALVVIDWWKSPTVERAHVALPSCGYGEFDGTVVNFQGRAQRLRAALRPPGEADPAWRILRDLGRRFGLANEYASAPSVFDEIAVKVPAFAGLTFRALGDAGAPVSGAAAPRSAGAPRAGA